MTEKEFDAEKLPYKLEKISRESLAMGAIYLNNCIERHRDVFTRAGKVLPIEDLISTSVALWLRFADGHDPEGKFSHQLYPRVFNPPHNGVTIPLPKLHSVNWARVEKFKKASARLWMAVTIPEWGISFYVNSRFWLRKGPKGSFYVSRKDAEGKYSFENTLLTYWGRARKPKYEKETLVIAGNRAEFQQYIEKLGFKGKTPLYVYARRFPEIEHRVFSKIEFVGTHWNNPIEKQFPGGRRFAKDGIRRICLCK